jgi:dipeptidyl aminopeptidase/acylaminoacyl peptidase
MLEFPARPLPPNALFDLRHLHDARLSPDGRQVAYVISRTVEEAGEELFDITIEDVDTRVVRPLEFGGRALSPRWSPDGGRIAFVGTQGNTQRLYVLDVRSLEYRALTAAERHVQGPPAWSPDGSTIAYTSIERRRHDGSRRITQRVYRAEALGFLDDFSLSLEMVDTRTGATRPLRVNRAAAMQPEFSPCGTRLLFLGSDTAVAYPSLGGLRVMTIDIADGRVVEVVGDGWFVVGAAWSPCGTRIVIAGDCDSALTVPTVGLWVIDRDGAGAQCRTDGFVGNIGLRVHHDMPTWNTSQNHVFIVPDENHAYATVMKHGCAEVWEIDLKGERHCKPVATGQRSCLIMDANAARSTVLYGVSDINRPWDLHMLDLSIGTETVLTTLNAAVLREWPQLKTEHIPFESADGLALEGWYLVRADRSGPQPTVMFIHGGPFLATGHAFRFDFHLLAANGYAVVFANFRGSAGYGEPFVRGIVGDWGARGFPDHMATVAAAVDRGLADPERLGVWGPSHGGFATCWVIGHSSKFRAAVVESAPTNFLTAYYLGDAPDWIVHDLGGRPDEIPDVYRSRSPLTYAWRCRTPTLILHGEMDLRCPLAEAEQLYRLLCDVGCTCELVQIAEMTHMGDSTGPLSARRAQNEALLDWFERCL